ncbi:MAG: hypothetical protein GX216_01715 [Methanomicrobiales archaeon]|nr:hypothetical protein [Methanomicrobiales archaeon]
MGIRHILSLLILFSLVGMAAALPVLPDEFAGSVTLDGKAAPPGTTITARIDWNERGSTVVTVAGVYGPLDSSDVLAVKATEDDLRYTASPIITFWVNGHRADQEIAFESGTARQLDLSAVTGGEETEPVPVASGGNSFEIEGVGVTDTDEGQQVVIDSRTVLGNITTNETAITLNDVEGWEEVIIFTKEKPKGDAQITGTVESVHARSSPVNTGTAWAQIDLEMSSHPNSTARLETTVFEKPGTDEQKAFEDVAYKLAGSSNVDISIACVLKVQKTGIANEGDGGIIRAATIRMAASPEWVASMGGTENVVILRQADGDDTPTELPTRYAGRDAAGNYIFEAVSSKGLSAFALVATKARDSGPGTGPSPPSGSSGGPSRDPGSQITYDPDAPEVYIGSAPLTTSPAGVVLESVTLRTADGICAVLIQEGTTALDKDRRSLGEVTGRTIAPADLPAAPPGVTVAVALECGPAGAMFDPPAVLTYTLSADEWAKAGKGARAKVIWYNPETGEWQDIPSTVNVATRTVTAEVSHFSIYALAWTAAEAATPASVDTTPPADQEPGVTFPVWALVIVIVLIAAVVAFLVMRKN